MNTVSRLDHLNTTTSLATYEKSMPLEQGKDYSGEVIASSDKELTLEVYTERGSTKLSIPREKSVDLKANDKVNVHVESLSKNKLLIKVDKIDQGQPLEESSSRGTGSEIELKQVVEETIKQSDNPLKYSQKLDQHIDFALSKVNEMVRSFSDGTMEQIYEEGFDVSKMTIDLLYQVGHSDNIDKKISLEGADRTMQIRVNDEAIQEMIHQVSDKAVLNSVDKESLEAIGKALQAEGVEINQKNVEKMIHFIKKVDNIKNMETKDILHVLSSKHDGSVKDLHKSLFISHNMPRMKRISDSDYKAIEKDVQKLLDQQLFNNGSFSDDKKAEVTELAKELVQNGVPISEEAVDVIRFVLDEKESEDYLKDAAKLMQKSIQPDNLKIISTSSETTILSVAEVEEVIETVTKVTSSDVERVIRKQQQVNIKQLQIEQVLSSEESRVQENSSEVSDLSSEETLEQVKKEMNHIDILRYQMTFKAVMRLNMTGYDIKNASLENLQYQFEHEEVKQLSVSEIEVPIDSVKDVPTSKELQDQVVTLQRQFAMISASSTKSVAELALEIDDTDIITVNSLSASLKKGADRYDELRTKPRPELGDRINQAFQNVDDILEDLKLEVTEENRRSVEILARNEMEITPSNIDKIKVVDVQLQQIMTKLMPEHVKELMINQVDILNEPIEKLYAYVESVDQEMVIDLEESIAKGILELNKDKSITDSQKEAVLGIYRMIHTIKSSKGAALGFLVDKKLPVTFDNLLEASKILRSSVNHRRTTDISVDDKTGTLVELQKDGLSIKEQIQQGFVEKENALDQMLMKLSVGSLNEYEQLETSREYNGLTELGREVYDILTSIHKKNKTRNMAQNKQDLETIQKISKTIMKEAMSLSKDMNISDINQYDKMTKNEFMLKELLGPVFEFSENFDDLKVRFEDTFEKYLNNMNKEGLEDFTRELKSLLREAKSRQVEELLVNEENSNKQNNEKHLEGSEISRLDSDSKVFEVAKEVSSLTKLQQHLSDQEEYLTIPLMVDGQMQQMNMYFFRHEKSSTEESGDMTVYLSFSTSNLGTANAKIEFQDIDTKVSVYTTEDINGGFVSGFDQDIRQVFREVGIDDIQLTFEKFEIPKAIGKDTGTKRNKLMKRYKESRYEQII